MKSKAAAPVSMSDVLKGLGTVKLKPVNRDGDEGNTSSSSSAKKPAGPMDMADILKGLSSVKLKSVKR